MSPEMKTNYSQSRLEGGGYRQMYPRGTVIIMMEQLMFVIWSQDTSTLCGVNS